MTCDQTAARLTFAQHTLPAAILDDPSAFYDAFSQGEDALVAYFTALWKTERQAADVSFFPDIAPFILEDGDDGFSALLLLTLSQTAAAKETVSAVVFGSAMDPRVFAALPTALKNGETLSLFEYRLTGQTVRSLPICTLCRGCDNDLQLFDPPTPQPIDPDTPLEPARREAAIVDAVVCWCLEND